LVEKKFRNRARRAAGGVILRFELQGGRTAAEAKKPKKICQRTGELKKTVLKGKAMVNWWKGFEPEGGTLADLIERPRETWLGECLKNMTSERKFVQGCR